MSRETLFERMARLSREPTANACPDCGARYQGPDHFCPKCTAGYIDQGHAPHDVKAGRV